MGCQDRKRVIAVAEAMGYKRVEEGTDAWWPAPYMVERIKELWPEAIAIDYVGFDGLPPYFTDAAVDYEVLEWARENLDDQQLHNFGLDLHQRWLERKEGPWISLTAYQTGDWTRSLYKVIT